MLSSKEEMIKSVRKLTEAHGEHIESVLSYRSIQGKERLVVVMRDEMKDLPEFLAEVYDDYSPPEGTLWLRRRELFQLTLGVADPTDIFSGLTEPFDSYRIKNRSEILYGHNIKDEIPDLDNPKGAAIANLTLLYLCYTRNHVILDLLSRKEYKKAAEVLLGILKGIMGLALVMKGKLDIEKLNLLDDFSKEYSGTEQDKMLSELFNREENMAEASEGDERWRELAYDAVWAFESLSRWIWEDLL